MDLDMDFIWCGSCHEARPLGRSTPTNGVPVNVWAWLGIHRAVGCPADTEETTHANE